MAKDAKGHGSDTRGGSNYARQAPTKNGRARIKLGRERNQMGIWDNAGKKLINTGGTGD